MKCPKCGYTDVVIATTNGALMTDDMLYGAKGISVTAIAKKFGSWLAGRKDLCDLIQSECKEHDIDEIYALALMQKEQSAFFRSTPPSSRAMDWIYGYGCPESGGRMSKFQGVENQIRCAIAQLRNYTRWENVKSLKPQKLYDSASMLKKLGFSSPFKPRSLAEAASMTYNPRAEGLVNQVNIIKKIILKGIGW